MLPNPQDCPPGRRQRAFVFAITLLSGLQLASPPLGVGLRKGGVLGTPVPKAAVDKHGYARPRKDDVCLAAESGHWPTVLEEAEAGAVKGRPQGNLWPRIPWAV